MLRFLRKIRRSLVDSGSAKKYFLYASGEVLLVMVGILLALQVNNWNQNRIARIHELNHLKLLKENLQDQSGQISLALRLDNQSLNNAFDILDYLEESPIFHDSMRKVLRYATTEEPTYVVNNAFELIKNTKLTNEELERKVHVLYERYLRRIDVGTSYSTNIDNYFEDYSRKHFNAVDIPISAPDMIDSLDYKEKVLYILDKKWGRRQFGYSPKNYMQLKQDEEFKLLLKKSIEFRTKKINRLRSAASLIEEILVILEQELS